MYHCGKYLLSGALLLCLQAHAQAPDNRSPNEDGTSIQKVTVTANINRDPEEKSYRSMLKGIAIFEQYRSMAPNALLRFKVYPRQLDVSMNGLAANIEGKNTRIPLQLSDDKTFVLPVDAQMRDDGAVVSFNRKAGSLTWRAEIRTPGLASNVRRLGDLRLECKVAVAADLIAYPRLPPNVLLASLPNVCQNRFGGVGFIADRPLFGITLVHGNQREIFPSRKLHANESSEEKSLFLSALDWGLYIDRLFSLGDYALNWPDDTLLEFSYIDDESTTINPPELSKNVLQ
jgi:hypothetical protein